MNSQVPYVQRGIVYVVDDDTSFRNSLCLALGLLDLEVAGFPSVDAFLASPVSPCSVVLTDMRMPRKTGLDLQSALSGRGIDVPVIFISAESTVNQAVTALKFGAFEFFTKPCDMDGLYEAICRGFELLSKRGSSSAMIERLSPREKQTLDLLLKGYGNIEVADELGIKVSTVKEYKSNIFQKLGVSKLSELIKMAHK